MLFIMSSSFCDTAVKNASALTRVYFFEEAIETAS